MADPNLFTPPLRALVSIVMDYLRLSPGCPLVSAVGPIEIFKRRQLPHCCKFRFRVMLDERFDRSSLCWRRWRDLTAVVVQRGRFSGLQ